MIERRINWGIIGCGWVARDYVAPAIRDAHNAKLVAICDRDEQAMQRLVAEKQDVRLLTEVEQFLQMPDLDAVYIATPNHLHRKFTEAAAHRGKHVLCEKPMATNFADAQAMVDVCERNNVRYATAFDQRFQARHRQLKQLVEDGTLGEITTVRVHYACWTPPNWVPPNQEEHDNWRVDPQRAGGGAFIDLAPHGLDLTQHLVGEPLVEVACLMQRRVFEYSVDDGAVLIGRFANDVLLSMNVAYNCPDNFPRRTLEIVGTRAMAIAHNTMGQTPGGTLKLMDAQSGTSREINVNPREDISPFQVGIEEFSRCLIDNVTFPFPPEGDLHTMRVLEEAQRSSGTMLQGVVQR